MRGVDAQISESLVTLTYNADLANNIGNLHSRTLKLAQKHFGARIQRPELESADRELLQWVATSARDALAAADLKTLPDLVQAGVSISTRLNGYFDQNKPWELAKQGQIEKLQCSLWTCLNGLRVVLELLWPIIPNAAARALSNLSGSPHNPVGRVHQFEAEASARELVLSTSPDNLFPRAGAAKR
jgi:methionyl-tRNA synthetase